MEQRFYNLHNGGSADGVLPIIFRHIVRHDEQASASTGRILDVGSTAEVTAVRLCRLDEDHEWAWDHTKALQEEVTMNRVEIREFQECHVAMERRVIEAERQSAEAREQAGAMWAHVAALRGPEDTTRHEYCFTTRILLYIRFMSKRWCYSYCM